MIIANIRRPRTRAATEPPTMPEIELLEDDD